MADQTTAPAPRQQGKEKDKKEPQPQAQQQAQQPAPPPPAAPQKSQAQRIKEEEDYLTAKGWTVDDTKGYGREVWWNDPLPGQMKPVMKKVGERPLPGNSGKKVPVHQLVLPPAEASYRQREAVQMQRERDEAEEAAKKK